ncbi:heavy metal translocating P-type ATPase [Paenibacillus sp. MB22_1]|uniref:heavy metal translocating P-type ATPase n=1 Tax=Paenibacillus sp. MB22_1 TaxID=3383121 RepID=UPI0039A3E7C3
MNPTVEKNQTPGENRRIEYRVQGLSCANCAREMQEEIQRLDHGKDASLLYNSGRLLIDPAVDLKQVERILKRDGATLVLPGPSSADGTAAAAASEAVSQKATEPGNNSEPQEHESRLGLWLLVISAVIYGGTFVLDMPNAVQIACYLAAIVLSGYTTFLRGLRNLLRLKFNMDTLMTVALTGAVIIGEWKEATLVAILFGLNELLEGYGMSRARRSLSALLDAAPKEAIVVQDGRESIVPIARLKANDIVLVRAGEKIPSDGTVLEGTSAVNEAAITGESIPVTKQPGMPVFGGSINSEGLLQVRIDKPYEDSSLAKIMHLVQEAQDKKTPTELFIDRFAKWYTPAIMILAALVVLAPPLLFGQPWMKWIYEGLAILIVGCPCALVLSSPIALVSGMTRCARLGVLVKGGVHLEQLGKLDAIAFDKTGTLTKGQPEVQREITYVPQRFYSVAAALERGSLHPLAAAVVRYVAARAGGNSDDRGDVACRCETSSSGQCSNAHGARADGAQRGNGWAQPAGLVTLPGVGVSAEVDGVRCFVGSEALLAQLSLGGEERARVTEDLARLKAEGLTVVLAAESTRVLGLFGLADELRPEAPDVVRALHRAGVARTVMLTGDHAAAAQAIADRSGVSEWHAGLLPEQKVAHIQALAGRGTVAMVGDGINDAPALAAADLGIAMGQGTDSAVETADIVLMQDHLGHLPRAIRIARRAGRIVTWNIGLSLALKLMALLLTIPGWLTLWVAVMSDMGATILVTLFGLTILLGKDPQTADSPKVQVIPYR